MYLSELLINDCMDKLSLNNTTTKILVLPELIFQFHCICNKCSNDKIYNIRISKEVCNFEIKVRVII